MYYRNRYYLPDYGRFLTPDPYTGGPDDARIDWTYPGFASLHGAINDYLSHRRPHSSNRYIYCNDNPVNFTDPLGLEVVIQSRYVKNMKKIAAHTWIKIENSKQRITYSGTNEKGKLGIKRNSQSDYSPSNEYPVTSEKVIKPPKNMTQEEWDKTVIENAEKLIKNKDEKRDYKLFGGDRGKTSGNCHVVTKEIIDTAGGEIPRDYNPPGLHPGLHNHNKERVR